MGSNFSKLYTQFLDESVDQFSKVDERRLIAEGQDGDEVAKDLILRSCYKLLVRLAGKIVQEPSFSESQDYHDALLSAGYASLSETFYKYDLQDEAQARFSTFAYRHVYGAMLRSFHADSNSLVAVPYKYRPLLNNKDSDHFEDLGDKLARSLDNAWHSKFPVELDTEFPGSGGDPVEPPVLYDAFVEVLCQYLYELPPDEQFILGHVFGACGFGVLSNAEIADRYGFSTANVTIYKGQGLLRLFELAGDELQDFRDMLN